jgi:predicted component of type VI protein secretion system
MEVKLIVVGGKLAGKELPVNANEFLIGRSAECHLRPRNERVSRRHCMVVVGKGSVIVRDFDSRNGTFVNGKKVDGESPLANGDRLSVGGLEFDVRLSVGVGAAKKSKIRSVGEAAARIAQSGGDDDLDVSGWLADEEEELLTDTTAMLPAKGGASPPTSENPASETARQEPNTSQGAAAKAAGEKKKAAPTTSRDAAADTLKSFFNRR